MPITGKQMLELFVRSGWTLDRTRGSHFILKKDEKTVVIPVHCKALGKGIESKLLKEGGFK